MERGTLNFFDDNPALGRHKPSMRFGWLPLILLLACGGDARPRGRSGPTPNAATCPNPSPLYTLKQNPDPGPVELSELVVTGATTNGFFAQISPTGPACGPMGARHSGVFIFTDAGPKPAPGEVISVSGVAALFFDQLQITAPSWSATGRAQISPVPLTTFDISARSPFEGVLVALTDVTITDAQPPPGSGDREPQNEYALNNGLRLDDFLGYAPAPLAAGQNLSRLVGILAWRNGHLKIAPRNPADLDIAACTPDCSGLACGLDPVCGQSCGTCTEGTCNAGRCEDTPGMGAPQIIRLELSAESLGPEQPVRVTLTAAHSGSLSQLVGATLSDEFGNYGALTQQSGGIFERTLTWQEAHQRRALNFGAQGAVRTLTARLSDNAGQEVTRTIALNIRCDGGESACDGQCLDLSQNPDNCGACGQSCADWVDTTGAWHDTDSLSCQAGVCSAVLGFEVRESCARLCRNAGGECSTRTWSRAYHPRDGFLSFDPVTAAAVATYHDGSFYDIASGDCGWTPPQTLVGQLRHGQTNCACTSQ